MMNILSAHGDPNKFGFRYDTKKMKEIRTFLEITPIKLSYWETTQHMFVKEKDYWKDTDYHGLLILNLIDLKHMPIR